MLKQRRTRADRSIRVLLWLSALASLPLMLPVASAAQRAAPMQVAGFRGQYCYSMGPRGWAVIAENPQRVGFGADMMSGDGKAAAGYSIFGVGTLNSMPGYENPDRAVASNTSRMGSERVQYGQRQQIAANVFTISYQTPSREGMVFWQVIPTQRGGAMVVLRDAYTPVGLWRARGAEASAVARSLRCNVPNVPPAADPPGLNPTHAAGSHPTEEGESDSLYNQWLDKEYYHNPQTGENFWVSPSQNFDQNGPQGPGYYAPHGNDIIKLQSGYAQ